MKKCFALAVCALLCAALPAAAVSTGFSETTGDGLKVITLSENTNEGHSEVKAEFGFSAVIEKGGAKIIFDTAKAGQFIENSKALGVDLAGCSTMVLSHAHYDHCGGVLKYFDAYGAKDRTLVVKDCFFDGAQAKYYDDITGQKLDFTDGKPGYFQLGINFTEKDLAEKGIAVKYLDKNVVEIAPGVAIHGGFTRVPLDPKMLVKAEDGRFYVDDFDEEVAVAVDTSKGIVIVTGCSHTGIVNIVNAVKERTGKQVYAVVGGFHLLDASPKQIQDCIDLFKGLGIQHLGLSHCTGPVAKKMFLEQFPENSFVNSTGSVFEMK
ncbi:MAG: MBL fold metallo-hydrolase [Pyramidobacter sp.]|nr:MBL fold metallo-hydrolase [Pyramidobacter sp.]